MKKTTSAHRARRIPIGGIGTILSAILATAACGPLVEVPKEHYVGSDRVKAVVGSYTPVVRGGILMIGDAVIPEGDTPATVTLTTRGQGPARIRLPSGCDGTAITARFGRMIEVRRDIWRNDAGVLRYEVSDDEIRSAVCDGIEKRDVPNPQPSGRSLPAG